MKRQTALGVTVGVLVFVVLFAFFGASLFSQNARAEPEVFVGVDVAYGDETAVYSIADAVAGYANLIILGSLNVTMNTTKLTTVCDYLYQKGFYFIVYVGFAKVGYLPPQGPAPTFFEMAQSRWQGKFLGAYMFDEVGGKQLDTRSAERPVPEANNNSDAAIHYVLGVGPYLPLYKQVYYQAPSMRLYSSDYALYWFDYLCGYDTIFCEFVGNQSRQVAVALTRGAATSQCKQWGAIVTFGSCGGISSCLENAPELYDDMMLAWQNGAKYIVVFDTPLNNTGTPYGDLTQEHLDTVHSFWDYTQSHKQPQTEVDTAYVLPADYGYGFRGPTDTIWGLWPADALSAKIWNDTNTLLATYGTNLDIVYDNRTDGVPSYLPYKTLIYWNGTSTQK